MREAPARAGDVRPVRPEDAVRRVWVEAVRPAVDGGRFPVKRVVASRWTSRPTSSSTATTSAGSCSSGAPPRTTAGTRPRCARSERRLRRVVPHRAPGAPRVHGGRLVDRFATWRHELEAKAAAGQDVASELLEGAQLVAPGGERAAGRTAWPWRTRPSSCATTCPRGARRARAGGRPGGPHGPPPRPRPRHLPRGHPARAGRAAGRARRRLVRALPALRRPSAGSTARSGTRSACCPTSPRWASTSCTCRRSTHRPHEPQGPRQRARRRPGRPGQPVGHRRARGRPHGGPPQLGTLEDFDHFVAAAREHGLEVALDLAFQCSPDHPYVREHPEWFRQRPDGTIKYAENRPRSTRTSTPCASSARAGSRCGASCCTSPVLVPAGRAPVPGRQPAHEAAALLDVVAREVRRRCPDTVFLSEAFTRPKLMYALAKVGFSQSYTYFTWRNRSGS